uniref:Dolichol kinase n=1 Tax=Chromera velia CCMP2878 TaxID=1169474 RepID=A0A0G4HCC6_9ALVE|eukprot:Cvel_26066.t1-p1 / transcript=Cvel_26066.t1 / gene=Cvel_26066 / organism=Chromera_velia_CCMP2878 / gene_product=hypothetical protein / transcript_product=hypothetical protein / location=Cvel_scaffold3041:16305-17258(-) / protein_length=318 / sequence_SO=supercontig / SO=protein_coding / is_pseudo=false
MASLEEIVDGSALEFSLGFLLVAGLVFVAARHGIVASIDEGDGNAVSGKTARLAAELQRKSFHMIGGIAICAVYHFGIKHGFLIPGNLSGGNREREGTLDGAVLFMFVTAVVWSIEVSRIIFPSLQTLYMSAFKDLVRAKEKTKAAGIAYFLPGALGAMLAFPPGVAILGILYLSAGDTAASIGTALGNIPIGNTPRKVEGSVGCLVVSLALGLALSLPLDVALVAAVTVTVAEVMAEIMQLDDNLVIPMMGGLGVHIGCNPPPYGRILLCLMIGLVIGVGLGAGVGALSSSKLSGKGGGVETGKEKGSEAQWVKSPN